MKSHSQPPTEMYKWKEEREKANETAETNGLCQHFEKGDVRI